MLFLFAVAIELFFDSAPESMPVDSFLPQAEMVRERLKERGWDLKGFAQGAESFWVFWNLGERTRSIDWEGHPKEKRVLFIWEPPTVQGELYDPEVLARFGKVFTWDDDRVDGVRFFKFCYPVLRPRIGPVVPFERKKFCVMVARRFKSEHPRELYSEREKTVRFFEDKLWTFDLYGHRWKRFKNYRGPVEDKLGVMRGYKFCICYENMRDVKGYITEKIFDCFAVGVVPVYWGASNIEEYVPKGCFVDRREFKDNAELYAFLKGISKREYEGYLEAADRFLKSEKAKVFSSEEFAKTFLKVVD